MSTDSVGGATRRTSRDVVDAYVDATNRSDWPLLRTLLAPVYIEDYPQSGERITGAEAVIAIRSHFAEMVATTTTKEAVVGGEDRWALAPNYTAIRITGDGDTVTAVFRAAYPDGDWYVIALLEVADGLIRHQTAYFAQDFEAPAWRRQWAGRMPARDR